MGNNFSHTRIPTDFEDMHKNLGIKFATDWNKNEIYLNLATEGEKREAKIYIITERLTQLATPLAVIASIKDIFVR
ncbi:hypothetical protein TL16_g10114 [Triparma laevis f. inornata]|uniref:Uncharacterized protein n=1 Tax=Triparma laevis f. inornata TaxID=1714386 RepID=A0A9W7BCB0_9STRA|nr:hypothetical protein TL16_g10114 [Triparma laevis f. inornata]